MKNGKDVFGRARERADAEAEGRKNPWAVDPADRTTYEEFLANKDWDSLTESQIEHLEQATRPDNYVDESEKAYSSSSFESDSSYGSDLFAISQEGKSYGGFNLNSGEKIDHNQSNTIVGQLKKDREESQKIKDTIDAWKAGHKAADYKLDLKQLSQNVNDHLEATGYDGRNWSTIGARAKLDIDKKGKIAADAFKHMHATRNFPWAMTGDADKASGDVEPTKAADNLPTKFDKSSADGKNTDKDGDKFINAQEEAFYKALQEGRYNDLLEHRSAFWKSSHTIAEGDNAGRLREPTEEEKVRYAKMQQIESELRKQGKIGEVKPNDDVDQDKNKETLWGRVKSSKYGKAAITLLASLAVLGGFKFAQGNGVEAGKDAEGNASTDGHKTEFVAKANADSDAAGRFEDFARGEGKSFTNAEKSEESREALRNNGKYDAENNDYNSDNKENKNSIGSFLNGMSIEEAQDKLIDNHNEDNIEFMGQLFVTRPEAAREFLGIENTEVDNLIDRAREGDQEAFDAINKAYTQFMDGAKVTGEGTFGENEFLRSIYVGDNLDYARSEGNFGGEYFEITRQGGEIILIRKNCQQETIRIKPEVKTETWAQHIPVIAITEMAQPPVVTVETPANTTVTTTVEKTTVVETKKEETPKVEEDKKTPPREGETPTVTEEDPVKEGNKQEDDPIGTNYEKDRSLEHEGTYTDQTQMDDGGFRDNSTQEELDNAVDPNAQSGTNVDNFTTDGAEENTWSPFEYGAPQYGGEVSTAEYIEQTTLNQAQHERQLEDNAAAKVDAESNETSFGDGLDRESLEDLIMQNFENSSKEWQE